MIQRILVPLDGSAVAEQALPVARRLTQATGGTVVLLRNVPLPDDSDYGASLSYSASAELNPRVQLALRAATHYLQEITTSSALAGVHTEIVTTFGRTAAMMIAVAQSRNIDVVVMGGHENSDPKHRVLGSVSQVVTRHAPVPILVLHDQTSTGDQLACENRPLRVLVPLVGSVLAESVLTPAAFFIAALASPGQAAIHLVQLVQLPAELDNIAPTTHSHLGFASGAMKGGSQEGHGINTEERLLQKTQAYLASVAQDMQKGIAAELGLQVTCSALLDAHVAHTIIRTAEGGEALRKIGTLEGCDCIAFATHGRVGLQFLAMGSVAERVLAGTRLPVLVIRPEAVIGKQTMAQEVHS